MSEYDVFNYIDLSRIKVDVIYFMLAS